MPASFSFDVEVTIFSTDGNLHYGCISMYILAAHIQATPIGSFDSSSIRLYNFQHNPTPAIPYYTTHPMFLIYSNYNSIVLNKVGGLYPDSPIYFLNNPASEPLFSMSVIREQQFDQNAGSFISIKYSPSSLSFKNHRLKSAIATQVYCG